MPRPTLRGATPTGGFAVAVLAAAFLSTTSIFIRHLTLTYDLPALVLAFWRDLFAVLTILPAMVLLRPALINAPLRHMPYLAAYGLLLAAFNALWTLSVALNGAAVATVLVYSSAAFTAVLGWWLLRERLGWAKVLAVTVSLSGCVLISGAYDLAVWRTNLLGITAGLLSGLAYAVYSLMGRSAAQRGLSPWTTLLYTFVFATLFLLVANLIPGGPLPGSAAQPADLLWLGDAWVGWGILFLLAAIPTVAGFGLYNVSLSLLPSSVANLIVTLEPAFTAVTAYVLLGERLTSLQIVGALLTLGGVVIIRLYEGWSNGRNGRRAAGSAASEAEEALTRG